MRGEPPKQLSLDAGLLTLLVLLGEDEKAVYSEAQ